MAKTLGTLAGRYDLAQMLGQGGMATVYRAYDRTLGVSRAIKVLNPEMQARASVRKRFLDEARAMARLHHKNVVVVHDVGDDQGQPFMVMELYEEGTLADLVESQGPLTPAAAAEAMMGVLDGLHAAHRLGIVHRDIKPQNVLLDPEAVPKLADFGIARLEDAVGARTRSGQEMGTRGYMAPEQQADAASAGPAADIYACGATLCALVTGAQPRDLYVEAARAVALRHVPPALAEVIGRATAYVPTERFASAEEMRQALESLLPALTALDAGPAPATGIPGAHEPAPVEIPPSTAGTNPAAGSRLAPALAVALVALALLGAGTAYLLVDAASVQNATEAAPDPGAAGAKTPMAAPRASGPGRATGKGPAVPAGPHATLTVTARPSGRVEVDGTARGKSPWSGPVALGSHTVRLRTSTGAELVELVDVPESGAAFCWDFETMKTCQ